jgi:two-component system LytT family response regulator
MRLQAHVSHAHVARLLAGLQGQSTLQRVVGKRNGTFHVLPLHTIEAFVTEGEQVVAVTANERLPVDGTLKDLEARLSPRAFLRIHKQALVSLDRLSAFEPCPDGSARVTLASGRTVSVGRHYAPILRHHLNCR